MSVFHEALFKMNLKLLTSQSTKSKIWVIKLRINQLVYYHLFLKYLERSFIQLETVANKIFSAKLCGFRKGHSSQNALLNFLKNWQKCLLTSRVVWTVSVDLNKANDCLSLDLLIMKLSAYGLTIRSLR